jgi:hypothetical protein
MCPTVPAPATAGDIAARGHRAVRPRPAPRRPACFRAASPPAASGYQVPGGARWPRTGRASGESAGRCPGRRHARRGLPGPARFPPARADRGRGRPTRDRGRPTRGRGLPIRGRGRPGRGRGLPIQGRGRPGRGRDAGDLARVDLARADQARADQARGGRGRAGASGARWRAPATRPAGARDRGRAAWLQARRRTAFSGVVRAMMGRSYVLRMLVVAPW